MQVHQGGEVPIELVTEPGTFLARIREYERAREIFIDTETAEWWTPSPRVALLQVYDGRLVTVFDTLATGMADVLFNQFVPRVMANGHVRKWAHNASYERRFLGGPRVQGLECTLRLARGIAFHRLPVETLSLASLANALCGVTLDKTLQNADWSVRPLSGKHLTYAAADTLWCARVREEAVDALAPATSTKSSSVIRWCSRNEVVGLAATEWRWWSDSAEEDQSSISAGGDHRENQQACNGRLVLDSAAEIMSNV